jgi:hypothetical protein
MGNHKNNVCRYCGAEIGSKRDYCNDVCLFASGQPKVIHIARYGIRCRVPSPVGGWVYGEKVTVNYRQWTIEVQASRGGRVLYRARANESRAGLVGSW